jgi:hypothetical protein
MQQNSIYLAAAAAVIVTAIVVAQLGYITKPFAATVVVIMIAPGLSTLVVERIAKAEWPKAWRKKLFGLLCTCFVLAGFAIKYSLGF